MTPCYATFCKSYSICAIYTFFLSILFSSHLSILSSLFTPLFSSHIYAHNAHLFRCTRITIDSLQYLLHFIDQWTNQRQIRKQWVTQCFVDLGKAFYSITRERLHSRIHAFKYTLIWYALYEQALVHVRCIGGQAKVITSTISVKQGCMRTLPHPLWAQHWRGSRAHHNLKGRGKLKN